ncbi:UDP-N-acetylglucosamine--N-acetylmuramyl-(pentapeptide) pyrophosphoryl-undecaprenol N-acetylglucosamine transferase [hydrothermal vent metagenome]|uniref:UDP-N-acetylglucosamine--N-acetylmuramyl-(Pentapeptide) pyrophosphoryl-undecaprenol N-acetylglucosamine transferase n=1 Tax=hydrothermal vent metagenome TaxID=652676 RepID=A0A3B0ZGH2_9ZZZZ
MGSCILIMAGGTGGHVFPALAVAKQLREQGFNIVWLGTKAGLEAKLVPQFGFDIEWITVSGLRGKGLMSWLAAPVKVLKALFQSMCVIKKHKPVVVLGMGGFVSGPGGLASWMLGRPLVIHEQNAIAGFTNRCLAPFSKKVLQAFPGAFAEAKKITVVGNPVREEIFNRASRPEPDSSKKLKVLVVGGSLGAQIFNNIVPESMASMSKQNQPEVWHQAGTRNIENAIENYKKYDVDAKVEAFIDDMATAYHWADIVLCRSGALTVSELAATGTPSILVPYPHAVDDHQTYNAKFLSDVGAAILVPQPAFTVNYLAELFTGLADSSEREKKLQTMALAATKVARPDATDDVVTACVEVLHV